MTLVFAFESEISNDDLKNVIIKSLKDIKSFVVKLSGYSKNISQYGNYLFLDIINGYDNMIEIHNNLYENLTFLKKPLNYIPHITVGNLKTEEEMNKAFLKICNLTDIFETIINEISVELIGSNEESIILMNFLLT